MTTFETTFEWMEVAKILVTLATPFIALAGAILLFFNKAKYERADILRKERLLVYRSYLEVLQSHDADQYEDLGAEGIALVTKLSPLQDQIALMAPDAVAKASLALISSSFGNHLLRNGKNLRPIHKLGPSPSREDIDASLAAMKPRRNARMALLKEMRKDIVQGTGIDWELTDVEDLAK